MKTFLLPLFFVISMTSSYSQLNYLAANAINANGTYTDLGANGTVITTPGFDDDNSATQNIGFNFTFNGNVFTQFILNTNGVIKLGPAAPADARLYDALLSTETNLVYPLNLDLVSGTGSEYRMYTSGAAPNRLCTIQFKNLGTYFTDPATAPQFSNLNFQIRLYETSNNIEFVYGSFISGLAASTSTITKVGIKGANATLSLNVTKGSATEWSAASFIDGNYTGNSHNIRNTVIPAPGRAYVFRSTTALPVTLSAFTGSIQNNMATLNWVTAYEHNNDRFEVEKCAPGSATWLKTGIVNAVDNNGHDKEYEFTDALTGNGKWLYRLKIVDKNGTFTYSRVVVLQQTGRSLLVLGQNYPNPVSNLTSIQYELGEEAVVSIELFSMDGKKIMSWQAGKQKKGSYNFPVDAGSLALSSGKYVYRLVAVNNFTGRISDVKKSMVVMR